MFARGSGYGDWFELFLTCGVAGAQGGNNVLQATSSEQESYTGSPGYITQD
jgi:hypothetical protein